MNNLELFTLDKMPEITAADPAGSWWVADWLAWITGDDDGPPPARH